MKATKDSVLMISAVLTLVLGATMLIVGCILNKTYFDLYADLIDKNTVLRPHSEAFLRWSNTSLPTHRHIYVFDVVNADDVNYRLAKPIVNERGPYTFRVLDTKAEVAFSQEDDHSSQLLAYRLDRQLEFVAEMSNGTLDDRLTVINMPAVTLATWARNGSDLKQKKLATQLTETLFRSLTVRQLLFGFKVPSWESLRDTMFKDFNVTLPDDGWFPGLINDANQKTSDNYTIYTGLGHNTRVRQLASLNGHSSLSFWKSKQSNAINGTDGKGWPPYLTQSSSIDVFDPLWCRSTKLSVTSLVTTGAACWESDRKHVETFVQSSAVYNNRDYERGFCVADNGDCMAHGVLDVSTCRDGYPLAWSEPHFYQSHDQYSNMVDGLEPNDTRHRTVVGIEPLTGSVVTSSRKLQMNANVRVLPAFPPTVKLARSNVFPVLWLSEENAMSEYDKNRLRDDVLAESCHYLWLQHGILVVIIFGAALIIVGLITGVTYLYVRRVTHHHQDEETKPLLH